MDGLEHGDPQPHLLVESWMKFTQVPLESLLSLAQKQDVLVQFIDLIAEIDGDLAGLVQVDL